MRNAISLRDCVKENQNIQGLLLLHKQAAGADFPRITLVSSVKEQKRQLEELLYYYIETELFWPEIQPDFLLILKEYDQSLSREIAGLLLQLTSRSVLSDQIWAVFEIVKNLPPAQFHCVLLSNLVSECADLLFYELDYFLYIIEEIGGSEVENEIWFLRVVAKWADFSSRRLTRVILQKAEQLLLLRLEGDFEVFDEFFEQFEWVYVYLGTGVNQEYVELTPSIMAVIDCRINEPKHALFWQFMQSYGAQWAAYVGVGSARNSEAILRFIEGGAAGGGDTVAGDQTVKDTFTDSGGRPQ